MRVDKETEEKPVRFALLDLSFGLLFDLPFPSLSRVGERAKNH